MAAETVKIYRKSSGHLVVGTWVVDKAGDVKILCPKCTTPLSLGDHEIQAGGMVAPGVACPCGWQSIVKLHEWGT
jgi:hypothetical protein